MLTTEQCKDKIAEIESIKKSLSGTEISCQLEYIEHLERRRKALLVEYSQAVEREVTK